MKPTIALAVILSLGTAAGCTCSKSGPAAGSAASSASAPGSLASSASATPSASSEAPSAQSSAIFSAPIAAAKLVNGRVLAAGLVVMSSSITVTSLHVESGSVEWTTEVLKGVKWTQDASLSVYPAGDGAAVMWHGPRDDANANHAVVIGPDGQPRGEPIVSATTPCTTAEALVWIESRPHEAGHVKTRTFRDGSVRDVTTLSGESTPSLWCGEHAVYALVEGDDDKSLQTLLTAEGSVRPLLTVMTDREIGDLGPREFNAFLVGDDIGFVRADQEGEMFVREFSRGAMSPWAKLKHTLRPDEDLVQVDANAFSAILVYTKDEGDDCKATGATPQSVHALVVDRKTHKESRRKLAAADCASPVGAVWIATTTKSAAVGWVEPGKQGDPAPLRGFAYRSLGVDAATPTHVEQAADAIVEAGCDANACYAAALVRDPGADGMTPEAVKLLRYVP